LILEVLIPEEIIESAKEEALKTDNKEERNKINLSI